MIQQQQNKHIKIWTVYIYILYNTNIHIEIYLKRNQETKKNHVGKL